jgi:lysine 2,3-aminomutase
MTQAWQDLIDRSFTPPSDVAGAFPARINPYFASLIREEGDPIWRQVVPSSAEVARERDEGGCPLDPLREEAHSPVANLVHRYPDRALLLVSAACPVLCRFCTRRRLTGPGFDAGEELEDRALAYLRAHPAVREVILSGGDPLLLPDARLRRLLGRLRAIPHVGVIRVHTRVPGALPQRVDAALAALLAAHHPVWMNLHFNHPRELTAEARAAVVRLADAGIALGSQTVLLAGVNDDPAVLARLFRELVGLRVRPYYLFQMDTVQGTSHFRVSLARALDIGDLLRSSLSGIAVPTLAIDLPEGGGKAPLTRDRVLRRDGRTFVRNLEGALIPYPDKPATDGIG